MKKEKILTMHKKQVRLMVNKRSDLGHLVHDFPILGKKMYGKDLVYLDNAATTQKPIQVINAVRNYYENNNANIHRGVYQLSAQSTKMYENTRKKIGEFINAKSVEEIIFVRGATEAINLVASSYGGAHVGSGDEVLVSEMEHHSNIVPWQILCNKVGAKLKVIPINDDGEIVYDAFVKLLTKKTKLLALTHASNSLGTINPVREMITKAHEFNVPVLIDGAQAVAHMRVDVQDLDCDFYVFSGHKMYGPDGVGVLYGKQSLLVNMPPYQGGGDMIRSVSFKETIYSELPHKFEAGTPNISGVIGLGEAVDYLSKNKVIDLVGQEDDLLQYASEQLKKIPGLRIIGNAKDKIGIISFVVADIHPHDLGTFLDREGIAVRTGHHCTQPVMKHFGISATARISFAVYNEKSDVVALVQALHKAIKFFQI